MSVDLCNIYCSRLEPMEIHPGKKSPSFGFSVTLVRGPSEGLEFPNPESLEKDVARASGRPGSPPVQPTWLLPLREEPFYPDPRVPAPLPVPSPGFLNYSVLTQRCYLPNTLPTHSCQFCLLVNSRLRAAFLDPASSLSCFKGNFRPTDPRAPFLACGWKQSCESPQTVVLPLVCKQVPAFLEAASRSRASSCFFDVHFKNSKTPRAGLLSRPVSPIK